MSNAAEIIAARLKQAGVERAFGIPGGEVLTLIKALDEQDIEFVMTKHENAGGFMAEGSYHASDAPGVLVATVGPGVANAINFIVNAQQDRVPVIYLTGRVDPKEAAPIPIRYLIMQPCCGQLPKPHLKLQMEAVDEIIDKAIALAMDEPPGPVHVDLPITVAKTEQPVRHVKKQGCGSKRYGFRD